MSRACEWWTILEKDGQGLNLTYEVRMGILGHTGDYWPETLEGQAVRRSDQIAYVNHDIDDAIRAGILTDDDIPIEITDVLGHSHRDRINTLVCDAIRTSREFGKVCLSPDVDRALKELRSFMFTNVYRNPVAKGEESKAKDMLKRLFEYYIAHPEALPGGFSAPAELRRHGTHGVRLHSGNDGQLRRRKVPGDLHPHGMAGSRLRICKEV